MSLDLLIVCKSWIRRSSRNPTPLVKYASVWKDSLDIMKPTCCLVWLLQGLQAEQCPGADQGVGVGAGDLQTGAGDLQQVPQVDGGDLQNRPPLPGL